MMKPLQDRVLLKPLPAKKVTDGGIALPEGVNGSEPLTCEVVEVGPGRRTRKGVLLPMDVKVGDKVMVERYIGRNFSGGGNIMVQQNEILGVVE